MRLWQLITLTILSHSAFNGSRMLVSLYAIHLHASPFTVGALMSFYSLLPMLGAVGAGRLVDRVGARWPMFCGSAAVALGIVLPFAWPRVEILFASSTLIGTGFMVFHVAVNQVVGALGKAEDRAMNFSWLALGFSTSGSLGPLMTGFAIDAFGHTRTFLLLAVFTLPMLTALWLNRPALPPAKERRVDTGGHLVMDLLRNRELRRVLIASGMLSMGWDLYTFVIPIHGSRIGLSASTIGTIMGSFALATFAVRLVMPLLVRRVKAWHAITAALVIATGSFSLFPFFASVPLLITLSFVLGIGLGCAQPMVMALLYNTSPPGRQAEAVGVRSTMIHVSSTVLPLAFGALGTALGMAPVFWSMAALLGASGYLLTRRQRRGRSRA
ncbi:MAG: MFS transporter [Pseudomonadota bacterium]